MTAWEVWASVVVLVLATAVARSSLWLAGHRINIPKRVNEMLRFAPACALAAIIAPDILMDGPQIHFELSNLKLLSGLAAIVFYLVRKNMLQTIIFGMLVFTGLRLLHVFQ